MLVFLKAQDRLEQKKKDLEELSQQIAKFDLQTMVDLFEQREEAEQAYQKEAQHISRLHHELGDKDEHELHWLMSSEYLKKVVNTRVIKICIFTKLVNQKFELSRMERSSFGVDLKPSEFDLG